MCPHFASCGFAPFSLQDTHKKNTHSRGVARLKVFRHNHEVENGRTSSISQHIMGFKANGEIANYHRDDTAGPLRYANSRHFSQLVEGEAIVDALLLLVLFELQAFVFLSSIPSGQEI